MSREYETNDNYDAIGILLMCFVCDFQASSHVDCEETCIPAIERGHSPGQLWRGSSCSGAQYQIVAFLCSDESGASF